MAENKKIIIAAGGTGGHLYPGLMLARELKKRGADTLFIIRSADPAKNILENEKVSYSEIPIRGMPRKMSLQFFTFIYRLIRSFFLSVKLLREACPDAVVGMGGYISFPVVIAAVYTGIPVLIHEQNYIPGFSNRLLSYVTGTVALSFDASIKYFRRMKTVVTGNPVRSELFDVEPSAAYAALNLDPSRFTVLVFGGSQGASGLNRITAESLAHLAHVKDKIQFIHLSGVKDVKWVTDEYNNRGFKSRVFDYMHEMGTTLAAADLVICRSGATTVAELALLKKKAILVPYPHATADHQWYNASLLAATGQAEVIREKDLTPSLLAERIKAQLNSFTPGKSKIQPPSPLPQQRLADAVFKISL